MEIISFARKSLELIKSLNSFTITNNIKKFPLYAPYGYGSYNQRQKLTSRTINNIFYNLTYFFSTPSNKAIKKYIINNKINNLTKTLKDLFNFYKSDKANHKYHLLYASILKNNLKIKKICEIGLGTNNIKYVSNMGKYGKPGASLRAFKEYLPNSLIYGLDIDKKILFTEKRIKTFYLDQLNLRSYYKLNKLVPNNLDLVIDDGLHSIDSSLLTLKFFLKKIKINGHICIEDIPKSSLIFWEFINQILSQNYKNYIFKGKSSYVFITKRIK